MKAGAKSFTFIQNEDIVRIPFFQRGYIWKEENWSDFLDDLLIFNKRHFLGSLIFKQIRTQAGNSKEVLVIDGQQRITTFSILLKALYDKFSPELQKNTLQIIHHTLFYKKSPTDQDYLIKIVHSQIDSDNFNYLMKSGIQTDEKIVIPEDTNSRILECYKFFVEKLTNFNEEIKKELFNTILDRHNEYLVVIDLDEDDEEQAIFDTINSAGVKLNSSDIIKNSLFQKVIQLSDHATAIDIYKETWEKIFLNDEETISFWEMERVTGRLKRDNIDLLLHSVAVIKGFYDPDIHTLSELARIYKDEISKFTDLSTIKSFIEEIKGYAKIYKEKMSDFDKSTLYSFIENHKRLLHILHILDISTFHPFILHAYKNIPEEKLDSIFLNLENFVIRRVISKEETKSFNKLCKEFIKDSNNISNKVKINNEKFLSGLKNISNKHAALLLFWIELKRRSNDEKCDLKELKYSYSLEHLMPQSWEEYWKNIPLKHNPDGSEMEPYLSRIDRGEKIYWLGNMTLLKSSLNSSLRNFEYTRKMEGEGRKKGIRNYADLFITKNDLVEIYDNGDKIWDENKIIRRTENLIKEINEIWKFL